MTMRLPNNYNSDGLVPHVIVYNSNWIKQLEYIHRNIDPNGTRDFTLKSWKISGGVNSDAGNCLIEIEDFDAQHTFKIKPDWIIEIYLYREQEELWFTGIITESAINRAGYNQQVITIQAYGYAHGLTQRFISITKAAYSSAEGITAGSDGIMISELAKFCLHNDAMLIPPADPNLTLDVEDIDITLGSFHKENQSQAVVLAELANIAGAVYGVTPELQFYFRSLETQSNFVITNDDLENRDTETLYIIRNTPYTIRENATRKAFTNLIGLDIVIQAPILADNGGTTRANTSYDYIGFSLDSYGIGELEDIQVFLQDREPGDGDLNWKVTRDNWDNSYVLAEGTITEAEINAVGATGGWITLGTIPEADEAEPSRANNYITSYPRRLWLDNSHSSYYILVKGDTGSYKRAFSSDTWDTSQSSTGQLRLRSTRETAGNPKGTKYDPKKEPQRF